MKSYAAVALSKDFGIGVMFAILSIGVIIGNLLAVICNKDTKNKKNNDNNRNDTHAGYSCGSKQHKCYRK